MIFTSYRFLLFILVLFILYYVIPKRFQWMLLLIGSCLFYSIAGIQYLIYIATTTLSTYFISLRLNQLQTEQNGYLREHKESFDREGKKAYKAAMKRKQQRWLVLCLMINFGILAVLKYSAFAITNFNGVLDLLGTKPWPLIGFVLPLGISFYTFQTMGYLIDVYREKYPYERNLFKLALFISFFPQLIQGPISRFDDLKETLFAEHDMDGRNLSFGLQRILWGYFKKLVIADRLLIAVNTIVRNPEEFQGVYVLLGMFFYAITLYADFTGGIDITIGVAEAFGIRIRENFERPYFSKSIAEYWRRWHITLGTWFKEYLFYPISISKSMLELSKKCKKSVGEWLGRRVSIYIASIVVWLITGIWHGAAWNFVVWGLLNCFFIMASQECIPLYERFHRRFPVSHTFAYRLFQVGRTFWLMSFLRAFDCYRDVGTTFRMYTTLITRWNYSELFRGGWLQLGLTRADYSILIAAIALLLVVSLQGRSGSVREQLASKPLALQYTAYAALFITILILGAYGVGYDASQFIYSQF